MHIFRTKNFSSNVEHFLPSFLHVRCNHFFLLLFCIISYWFKQINYTVHTCMHTFFTLLYIVRYFTTKTTGEAKKSHFDSSSFIWFTQNTRQSICGWCCKVLRVRQFQWNTKRREEKCRKSNKKKQLKRKLTRWPYIYISHAFIWIILCVGLQTCNT